MLLFALASLICQVEPVARWTFDGDVQNSGPSKLSANAGGRLEFIDSPVSGKAAVFNGVDTFVEITPPKRLSNGNGDFSLSAWVFPIDRRPAPLFSRWGWTLRQIDGGALRWEIDDRPASTSTSVYGLGQWNHVVISLRLQEQKHEVTIYVNGAGFPAGILTSMNQDPFGAPILIGKDREGKLFTGLIDDVRIYNRALTAEEAVKLTDEGMPWIRPKAHAKTPFGGKFELLPNDVVVFAGGENGRVGQEFGYLETLLALHASGKRVRFRNMAWEGDTVYEQPRPLNFGSWSDHLRRTGASVVVLQFGQVEALEGMAGVERFAAAYDALVGQFAATTKRLVLVSPVPFDRSLSARNDDLKLYVEAIRKVAAKRECLFVDLSTVAGDGFTRNGLHLTSAGQWAAARETARQLQIPGLSDLDSPDAGGAFRRESLEKLRGEIRAKNDLWTASWRPTNWAFLNGDRMEQPSSRDHLDRRVRWFPVEVQQLPALVLREEEKIETLLQAEKK